MKYIYIMSFLLFGCGSDVFTVSDSLPSFSDGGSPPGEKEQEKRDREREPDTNNTGGSTGGVIGNLGGEVNAGGEIGTGGSDNPVMGGSNGLPESYDMKVEFDKEFLSGNVGTRYQYVIVVCNENYTVSSAKAMVNFIFHVGEMENVNNLQPESTISNSNEYGDFFEDPHHPLYLDYEVSTIGENPCEETCPMRSWARAETAGGSAYNSPGSWYEYNTSFLEVTCSLND